MATKKSGLESMSVKEVGGSKVACFPTPALRAEARHQLRLDYKCLSVDYKEGQKEFYLMMILPYKGLSPRALAEKERADLERAKGKK